jgi:hypothetical protein
VILNGFTSFHQDDLMSGYYLRQTLSATSMLARDCVRRVTIEPSWIEYLDGPIEIDAATDVICLDFSNEDEHKAFCFVPEKGAIDNIRRVAIRVTNEMWLGVLRSWFVPGGIYCYAASLRPDLLGLLMASFPKLEAFYFILADVTVEDWEEYYQSKLRP